MTLEQDLEMYRELSKEQDHSCVLEQFRQEIMKTHGLFPMNFRIQYQNFCKNRVPIQFELFYSQKEYLKGVREDFFYLGNMNSLLLYNGEQSLSTVAREIIRIDKQQ